MDLIERLGKNHQKLIKRFNDLAEHGKAGRSSSNEARRESVLVETLAEIGKTLAGIEITLDLINILMIDIVTPGHSEDELIQGIYSKLDLNKSGSEENEK